MAIPIKIHCECGQRYAFDVETVGNLMSGTVACPVCGADGTAAANVIIAQSLAEQPAVTTVPENKPRIRITNPSASTQAAARSPASAGQRSPLGTSGAGDDMRKKGEVEARAKILWGDSTEEVIRHLMIHGFSAHEASDKVRVLMKERVAEIRATGIRKFFIGALIAFSTASVFLLLFKFGFVSLYLHGIIAIACVFGLWMMLQGAVKVLAPRTVHGDAAEND